MEITSELVRKKKALYSKKPSLARIVNHPSMKVYFDHVMYRPFLDGETELPDAPMHMFGDNEAFVANSSLALPDLVGGIRERAIASKIQTQPGLENDMALLAEDAVGSSDMVSLLNSVLSESSWTLFLSFRGVSTDAASALFDAQDTSQSRFVVSITTSNAVSVSAVSSLGLSLFTTDPVFIGEDAEVIVRVDDTVVTIEINGERAVLTDVTYEEIGVVLAAISAEIDGSTIGDVCTSQLSMFALYNSALSDKMLDLLKRRNRLINRDADFSAVDVPPSAPVITGTPTISGESSPQPLVGDVLTVNAVVSGSPTPEVTYQWFRVSGPPEAIVGATLQQYTLQAADVAYNVYCEVTASNSEGDVTVQSEQIGPVGL